jgi:tetratricopeptide (TPR) repeat protein
MTRLRLVRTLVVAALVVIIAVVAFRRVFRPRNEAAKPAVDAPTEKAKLGLDLGLVIWPGGQGDTSLLVLRLWSGALRQDALDNAARKEGEKRTIEPLVLSIPKESWTQAQFWAVSGDAAGPEGAGKKLGSAVLVSSPGSESVSLGPRDTLTAMYRIASADLPPPETLIRAELKTEHGVIVSDPVPVPHAPESEKGILLRKAEIRLKLGSHSEAGLVADEIIGRYPEEPAGYWIKGQAREDEGAPDEALLLYQKALEKALAHKDAASHEPPLPIILKIRMLEERLAGDKKPPGPGQEPGD